VTRLNSGCVVVAMVAAVSIAAIVLIVLHLLGGDQEPGPVCHSVTEDSTILDCDYRDGGWYQR
jgi:hypothetical protein